MRLLCVNMIFTSILHVCIIINILAEIHKQNLSQNTANTVNFHYRTNSVNTNFSINSKNPVFGPFLVHFPNFRGKYFFPRKMCRCHAQLDMGFEHHVKIKKKLMIQQFQENARTDGRTDGRTDERMEGQMKGQKVRQSRFHRTQLNGLSLIYQAENFLYLWMIFSRRLEF